jgi:ATP-dependent Clp protease ATP-binding subunit ClpC
MDNKFTRRVQKVLEQSRDEAVKHNSSIISPTHILLALMKDEVASATMRAACNDQDLFDDLCQQFDNVLFENTNNADTQLRASDLSNRIIKLSMLEARMLKADAIDSVHLLLALFHNFEVQNMTIIQPFINAGITYEHLYEICARKSNEEKPAATAGFDDEPEEKENQDKKPDSLREQGQGRTSSRQNGRSSSDTPMLNKYGHDLTIAAQGNRLDPVVGREVEIERVAQILSRRKKNNPVLIGEPGVGKSAIVEGLAIRIVQKKVSRILFNKRVISLDLASVVAGTKYRGEFEERIKAILNELAKTPNVILFIDEIHTIVGAGNAQGSMDAANILKPALARGEIQCIGATTLDEYRTNIEKDGALERRFQKVMVEPTSSEETLTILNNIKSKYEEHHNVTYTDAALQACVKLTERYISDRNFPDKAIDALDEAGSRVHITNVDVPEEIENLEREIEQINNEKRAAAEAHNFHLATTLRNRAQQLSENLDDAKRRWEENLANNRVLVDEDKVAEVVAMMTGVPVQRIAQAEGKRLLEMGPTIQGSVIGQDEAVKKVVKAIQRNRLGLKDPNKPIGVFMFLGPTGVGKTYLAKKLAEYLFDSAETLIRIDMSEYMEKFTVSRLVGAPPGYVGYEEGGQLTERVRRHPYSVILLDEIEKAHPDVFNLLLQVMDEGRLTDSLGRRIDFKNTIIIMTSNIGTRQLKDFGSGVGFATPSTTDKEYSHGVLQKALNKAFSPEFLNRIDDIIMFDQLDRNAIYRIIDLELKGFYHRLSELGYTLTLSDEAKNFIASKGYDSQFGARPLKRAIQKYLEDELADLILNANLLPGNEVIVDYNRETERIETKVIDLKLPSPTEPTLITADADADNSAD